MGTEVHSKMYVPGYHSVKDPSDIAGSGSWSSSHYENKTLKNGQFYDIFSTRLAIDKYMAYDKEQLRVTILKHESMFRHQLQELHRLYRIQRDLMIEIESKELHKHSIPAGTAQSTFFSPSTRSEDEKKRHHTSSLSLVNSYCGSLSMLGADSIRSHFNSINGKILQSSRSYTPDGASLKNYESSESQCKKLQKRLIDLELPADEYINDEVECLEVSRVSGVESLPIKWNTGVVHNINVLSIGSDVNPDSNGDASRLRSTHDLIDLNEPIQVKEASTSVSVDILRNITCFKEEIQRRDWPANSCSGVQCLVEELSQNSHKGRIEGVSNLLLENGRNHKNWLSNNFRAGNTSCFLQSFGPDNLPAPFETLQVEPRKAHEPATVLSNLCRTQPQIKRIIFGVEVSDRDHDSSVVASDKLGQHLSFLQSDAASVSSQEKLQCSLSQNLKSEKPNCCNTSAQWNKNSKPLMQIPEIVGDWLHVNTNSKLVPNLSVEIPDKNGLCIGSQFKYRGLDCRMDEKSVWDVNNDRHLNKGISPPYFVSVDRGREKEIAEEGLSWLRGMPSCNGESSKSEGLYQMNLEALQNYSQQFSNKSEIRKGSTQSLIPDLSSVIHAHDVERSSHREILGFPIFTWLHMSKDLPSSGSPSILTCANDSGNSVKLGSCNTDLVQDPMSPKSGQQLKVENMVTGNRLVNHGDDLRHCIDLNICEMEEEPEPNPSSQRTTVKIGAEIDLEVPVDLQSKLKESPYSSQVESEESNDQLIRVAAEALIAISSSHVDNLQDSKCHQSEASPSGFLHWFADIISLYTRDIENEFGPDCIDYFEYMTLKLPEMKAGKPPVLETSKDETTLPKQPRRGQPRRGRQRRDFQRDVMPGLASLSRYEVTEDLQAMEGIIRATGGSWQSALAQRNASKNGLRRGKRHAALSTVNAACQPPIQQPKCGELGLDKRSLTGWGKRTRRLPRQRCPVGSPQNN